LPARRSLILHHLTYERVGNESDEDLRLLCKECHREAHRVKIPFGISWLSDQIVVTGIC
jgi:predicted HNH restriction endonuclease